MEYIDDPAMSFWASFFEPGENARGVDVVMMLLVIILQSFGRDPVVETQIARDDLGRIYRSIAFSRAKSWIRWCLILAYLGICACRSINKVTDCTSLA